ncbi:MAG: hypothetical protein PHI63_05265 [Patescibacteria group bacterium]|nr:hypothetical protein [Patescibacteria group bacterium]
MFLFKVEPRKVWPRYQGRSIRTHPITGLTNRILVAYGTGDFYVQYWEEGKERGDDKVRRWRRFGDIWSLHRGLRLAREGTILKRIPTIEELQRLCTEANLQLSRRDVGPDALQDVKRKMLAVLRELHHPKTHALKDVVTQVECVIPLRDSRGRLNLGALAARLVPVKNRLFVERLSDITGWLGHYAHWEQDIAVLQQLAGGFLTDLERKVNRWVADISDVAGWRSHQVELSVALALDVEHLKQLEPFGGWTNWARACTTDFERARTALHRADRDTTLTALRRLQWSVAVKRLQKEISDLLLDIQLDQLEGNFFLDDYSGRIDRLLDTVAGINDADFRHPVVSELTPHLRGANSALVGVLSLMADGKPVSQKSFKPAYDHLRSACAML